MTQNNVDKTAINNDILTTLRMVYGKVTPLQGNKLYICKDKKFTVLVNSNGEVLYEFEEYNTEGPFLLIKISSGYRVINIETLQSVKFKSVTSIGGKYGISVSSVLGSLLIVYTYSSILRVYTYKLQDVTKTVNMQFILGTKQFVADATDTLDDYIPAEYKNRKHFSIITNIACDLIPLTKRVLVRREYIYEYDADKLTIRLFKCIMTYNNGKYKEEVYNIV